MKNRSLLYLMAIAFITEVNAERPVETQWFKENTKMEIKAENLQVCSRKMKEDTGFAEGITGKESSELLWAYRPNSYQLLPTDTPSNSGIAFLGFSGSTTYHYDFPPYHW